MGARDVKIVFKRNAETGRTAANEVISGLVIIASAYAEKTDVSDGEKVTAGHEASARVARFVFRSVLANSAGLNTKDTLHLGGVAWNIKGVKDAPRRGRGYLEVTAVAASG